MFCEIHDIHYIMTFVYDFLLRKHDLEGGALQPPKIGVARRKLSHRQPLKVG